MRPRTLRAAAERALARGGGNWRDPLAEFLDAFYAASSEERGGMVRHEPPRLGAGGDPLADAYLGAVGEHLARRWGLVVPSWVRGEGRALDRPLFEPDLPALRPYLLRHAPVAFRSRLIFVGAEPLQRKGFCPGSGAGKWVERSAVDRCST